MISHNHIDFLRNLGPRDFDNELRQELADSLQELVACVEPVWPREDDNLNACVIDDFQVQQVNLGERDCRVRLRFIASARHGTGAKKELERITGRGEAVIDDNGLVRYVDVAFVEDPSYVAHDLGGGD